MKFLILYVRIYVRGGVRYKKKKKTLWLTRNDHCISSGFRLPFQKMDINNQVNTKNKVCASCRLEIVKLSRIPF